MLNKIKDKIKQHYIKKWHLDRNQNEHLIMDINFNAADKNQKKVLICYIDYVEATKDIKYAKLNNNAVHTNRLEFFEIIRAFIKLDCSVDVCSCNDVSVIPSLDISKYDILFGFGDVYRAVANSETGKNIKKIFYFTENPYDVSMKRETERVEYFNKRHNANEKVTRSGLFYKKDDEKTSDAIITMCNPKVLDYVDVDVKYIAPTASIRADKPDFSKRKDNCFFVFGTNGFIHKGIDLLVEVFWKHPEWELYVCGGGLQDTASRLGYGILPNNIHDVGYISVNDDIFKELTDMCTYILLPSCSEGTSTGVLAGMCRGMIPIISRGSGLDDMDEYIYFFDGYSVDEIESTIYSVLSIKKSIMLQRSNSIYEYALITYRLSVFEDRIFEKLYELLSL